MAEEGDREDKTEAATPKRREDAREQGQVALSQDSIAAMGLLATCVVLVVSGGLLTQQMGLLLQDSCNQLGSLGRQDLSETDWSALFTGSARALIGPMAVVVVPMILVVLLTAYAQVGIQITPKAIAWNPGRLNPMQGWGRIFSKRGLIRTGIAFAKISIVTFAAAYAAWSDVPKITGLVSAEIGPALRAGGSVFAHAASAALVAIVLIAFVDLLYQRWQHEKDLRMSKKDLRDEIKTTDGDPQVKARIRQVQREMARRRMMADVPKATVVVTNPTHYAVALRYDRDTDEKTGRAPVVVAKGVDAIAQRIKEVAREAGVPLHEDVPLARALHAQVEIGQEVPERLFGAVAGVLAYVYRLQGGKKSAG